MIFVPLPFVVALLLLVLLVRMLRAEQPSRPFLALVGLCILQSVLLGLRWGYDMTALRYVLPVVASCLPPIVLAGFRSLIHRSAAKADSTRWLHAAAPGLMLALVLFAPALIDAAMIVIFVGYALAVLDLSRAGPDALDEARLDGAVAAHRALVIAALALCVSAFFDFAILMDFEWSRGENAAFIVSNANFLGLFLIGLTAIAAARAQPQSAAAEEPEAPSSVAQDREVLDRVRTLLAEQKLARDENLTLSRLARRAGVPARQISGAVNRQAGKNVSQFINDFRIAEACRLLSETDMSVTSAMLESGFQTKSNFNREFRRVTSLSPASWRERSRSETLAVVARVGAEDA
ncbi:AraC family transcriptional regulator [Mesorhizobium sp. GbtcB19]|uniref:helix-turn-helix domain-containing protein n=1 Tax=Mesorhizobium sp. GbtcB19 TaxID=2824764 RepID=UPI001C305612|nr:AraC family transcriptional regulator [Mesorhizobium sp. GbtcB19]